MHLFDSVLLPAAYFGPVYYFRTLVNSGTAYIEQHEHYLKQTYRNRCVILAANGPLPLVVPVEHGRRPMQKITDIRIAYHMPWQRNHWRSITSAYMNSPYFDHYAEDFIHFFEKRYTFLFDLDIEITRTILGILKPETEFRLNKVYGKADDMTLNMTQLISPKTETSSFDCKYSPVAYTQVFEDKFSFVPDLSILDLIFCKGPEAIQILKHEGIQ